MQKARFFGVFISSILVSGPSFASDYTIPHSFTAGQPAVAADVNANFSAAKTAIDDNHSLVQGKQNRVTGTCAVGSSIRVINADGTVSCEVDSDSGGDITSVGAGSGLSGGGTTGSVTLSVPVGGITGSHIASETITNADVANGTLYDVDMADEAGLDYFPSSGGIYYMGNFSLCNTWTQASQFTSVSVTAPTSGYIMVTATGNLCTYDAGEYTAVMMDDASTGFAYDSQNVVYDSESTQRACGVGQFRHFAFQNVYSVAAGTHTYYLKGCRESTLADGYVRYSPMIGVFFPTRY